MLAIIPHLQVIFQNDIKIEESTIVVSGALSQETEFLIIDPTTTQPGSIIDISNKVVMNGNIEVSNASNFANENWTSNGWSVGDDIKLFTQVADLVALNTPSDSTEIERNVIFLRLEDHTVVLIQAGNQGSTINLVPEAPTNVKATYTGDDRTFSWDPADRADAYIIGESSDGVTWSEEETTSLSKFYPSVQMDKMTYLRVASKNIFGTSEYVEIQTMPQKATGGVVTRVGDYYVHRFSTVGSSQILLNSPITSLDVEYLVVGGGGSGASGNPDRGGGGAGGMLEGVTTLGVTTSVTVGAGGAARTGVNMGLNGGSSSLGSIVASGGGGGGNFDNAGLPGGSGGGGGGTAQGAATRLGGSGIAGQGHNGGSGGSGSSNSTRNAGGGGGGAGGVGSAGNNTVRGGNGGPGKASSITGTSVIYAGGGGGAASNVAHGTGGAGGGGNGGGGAGTNGLGGGGGGGPSGGAGGSGVVIIRYPIS